MSLKNVALFTVSFAALSLAMAIPANAQQEVANSGDDDFHTEKEIVVTAPYIERLDILSGTSALSGEDLAAETQGQIGDMLTSIPGVSATSFSPGASRPVLRGFQGNRVAVLTDGMRKLVFQ